MSFFERTHDRRCFWWRKKSISVRRGTADRPHALGVFLSGFHIYIYGPEVPPFGMRVNHALEQRLSALRFAQLVFKLGKLGDGLEIWTVNACVSIRACKFWTTTAIDAYACASLNSAGFEGGASGLAPRPPVSGSVRRTVPTLWSFVRTFCKSACTALPLSVCNAMSETSVQCDPGKEVRKREKGGKKKRKKRKGY